MLGLYRKLSKKGIGRFIPKKFVKYIQKRILEKDNLITMRLDRKKFTTFRNSSFDLVFRGIVEMGTTKLFKEISKEYDLFVDIGSCCGYYILLSEAKRNIAVEPEKDNYELLIKNVEQNKIENTECLRYAIGDKHKSIILHKTENPEQHTLRNDVKGLKLINSESVQMKTLDTLLEPYLDKKILCKIDTEGYEPYAFLGLRKTINLLDIDFIFEYNHNKYNETENIVIVDFVKDYNIYVIDELEKSIEKISYENFIRIKEEKEYYCNVFISKNLLPTIK
ncbi:MAG: FkbM family methyltransferase [Candidatus Heimdallarchaeota archaeon]|nr:FkbM family methyltransferase [Candidatus Heimdallarchaeota archaeon]MCK4610196.1 FkbM family methyltransferase [Candidatus Heimdallarchaeota archaeon]